MDVVYAVTALGFWLLMAGMAPALGFTTDQAGLGAAFGLSAAVALVAIVCFVGPLYALRHRFDERIEPLEPVEALPASPALNT